jgi:hypothetical protein
MYVCEKEWYVQFTKWPQIVEKCSFLAAQA